jgi:hypothetical protein
MPDIGRCDHDPGLGQHCIAFGHGDIAVNFSDEAGVEAGALQGRSPPLELITRQGLLRVENQYRP